jgi:hypothetical protein
VKVILNVLCFRVFFNVFVLKRENKREKEKVLSNKCFPFYEQTVNKKLNDVH